MKLQLYIYKCKNCGNTFKATELLGEPYGEFLLRSKTGEATYLHAISNPIFKEVSQLLKSNSTVGSLTDMERATILHEIFGVACDLAPDNSEYKIGGDPICPNCKSNEMYSWEPVYPPEIVEEHISNITHKSWSNLSELEKESLVDEAIQKCFAKKQ